MDKNFQACMEIVDLSASKNVQISTENLIHILRMLENSKPNRQAFTDLRKGLWFRLVNHRLDEFTGDQLLDMMHLVWKELGSPDQYYPGFFSHWELMLVNKLESVADPLSVLRLYASIQHDMPEELVEQWSGTVSANVAEMDPSTLTEIMTIFASMKVRPDGRFLDAWSDQMRYYLSRRRLDQQQAADVVYASGKLDVDRLREPIKEMLHDVTQYSIISKMNPQQLTQTLYGSVLLKINNGHINAEPGHAYGAQQSNVIQPFNNLWWQRVPYSLDKLNEKGLSYAIWSVPRISDGTVPQNFLTDWSKQFSAKANKCTAQNLAMIMDGLKHLAGMQVQIPATVPKAWMNRAEKVMDNFWPQALPHMLNGLHDMNGAPSSGFLRKILQATKPHLAEIGARDYAKIVLGFANFDANIAKIDPDFLRAWTGEAMESGKYKYWSPHVKNDLRHVFEKYSVSTRGDLDRMLYVDRNDVW